MDRKTAVALGLPRYITGNPCKHGHHAERYTVSGACTLCANRAKTADRQRAQKAINDKRRETESA